ncbi:MAG: nucleoside triphosphate pyrophosphohydrolase [Chloroflexi bacterium]|nr:nucleoside triphosphate pyrophosphohydrolase [Chloroflexota bacterium]
MTIVIVGLGPGDPGHLTREAWDVLERAPEIYVRTREHPTVEALPADRVRSFDAIYAREEEFAAVYEAIARRVVELGQRPEGVVYAVPGHPRVGERTTPLVERMAGEAGVEVRLVAGVSFLEVVFDLLRLDPLEESGLQIVDAMIVAQRHYPPLDPAVPALIAQCYNRFVASDVKLTLLSAYPDDHPVVVLSGAGTEAAFVREVPLMELDRDSRFDYLTTLYVPPVAPGGSVTELLEVIARLRAPDGCPWDRQQTHASLRTNLLEETYEVLDALDREDIEELREELGDLLMQIVFHTQIATEEGEFRMTDVARGIVTKLWRRHPHVFGDVAISGVGDVIRNWEAIKEAERRGKPGDNGPLAGLPRGLPALTQARAYLDRSERVGIEQPADLPAIREALMELEESSDPEEQLGKVLMMLVDWARRHGLDAESALRSANARLAAAVERAYASSRSEGS